MTGNKKADEKQSFIGEARREQIIEAASATLNEIGYANASLAQIAKRAGISTALISYHFKDKRDLMDHTLMALVNGLSVYVLERTSAAVSARDKLYVFIISSLAYQATRPRQFTALVEIVFHARTDEDVPYYKLNDEPDPLVSALHHLLSEGQSSGEFRAFNVFVMVNAIQGAIGEYMLNPYLSAHVDLEAYGTELVRIFESAILQDTNTSRPVPANE